MKQINPVRYRWSDIRHYDVFEIMLEPGTEIKKTYFNEFLVFTGYLDLGVDKPDLQRCEFSIPSHPFMIAWNGYRPEWRQEILQGKHKLRVQKLRDGKMKILQPENWEFIEGKWVNKE